MRLRFAIPALALGGVLAAAPSAEAQRITSTGYAVAEAPQNRGQLGVRGDIAITQEGRALRTVIVVRETSAGSPARRAGLQRGDSIIAIDGRRLTVESWAAFREGLRPGDEVRLTLLRDGDQREVLLEAEPASYSFSFSTNWTVNTVEIPEGFEVDVRSIQDRVVRAFEEARVRMAEEPDLFVARLKADSTMTANLELVRDARREGFAYAVRTEDEGRAWVVSARPPAIADEPQAPTDVAAVTRPRIRVGAPTSLLADTVHVRPEGVYLLQPDSTRAVIHLKQVVPLPSSVMRMGGEVADSLTGEWVRLRSQLTQLERERAERERAILDEARRRAEALRATDEELARLHESNQLIYEQMAALEEKLRAAGERNDRVLRPPETAAPEEEERAPSLLGRLTRERDRAARDRDDAPRVANAFVSARVVGEHWVMGAQVRSLTPRLAEYFQADEGVLVVEVLEGAPAAEAGILPGDVIVRAGRHEVRDVTGLRRALAEGRSGLRFRVVRRGEQLTLILPD